MRFGKKDRDLNFLETRLREERPEAHDEFVDRLVGDVPRRRGFAPGLRLAAAMALTVLLLVPVAALGALSSPLDAAQQLLTLNPTGTTGGGPTTNPTTTTVGGSTVNQTTTTVGGSTVNPTGTTVGGSTLSQPATTSGGSTGNVASSQNTNNTSANNQYQDKVTICHRDGKGRGNTITVSQQGANNHLQNHPGDTAGPCPPR